MKNDFELREDGDFKNAPVFTLFDEEQGCDAKFTLLARTEYGGKLYYALTPMNDPESYVIVEVREDGEDILFESVENDSTFEALAEIFDEMLDSQMDYDA